MKKVIKKRKFIRLQTVRSLIVILMICTLALTGCDSRLTRDNLDGEIKALAEYVKEQVKSPEFSSTGGDWAVIGIKESGIEVEEGYFDVYYDNVRAEAKSRKGDFSDEYYTCYSRAILGLVAIGREPQNVEGYDLIKPLEEKEAIKKEGISSVAYALMASKEAGYTLSCESEYIDFIVKELKENDRYKDKSYADYTAICLRALALYIDEGIQNTHEDEEKIKNAEIKTAYDKDGELPKLVDACLKALSSFQNDDGTYDTAELACEIIKALCALGFDPFTDTRFIKNENNIIDGLYKYKSGDGFSHVIGDAVNQMASEQVLITLESIRR